MAKPGDVIDVPSTLFVDEWDVARRPRPSSTRSPTADLPEWWKPVYIDVTRDGEYTHQHFKGRLPYHLHTRTPAARTRAPAPRSRARPSGDLRGTRHLDAEAERRRLHPRALRLARARRPPRC